MASTGSRRKKKTASTGKRSITAEDLQRLQIVEGPQISPDGSAILFVKKHVGEKNNYVTNLWMVDARGDAAPAQFTSGEKDRYGRWSPDGEHIALISERDEQHANIYLMPAGGGEATRLTDFPEGSVKSFQWSPDGKRLAVQYRATDSEWTKKAGEKRSESGASTPARVIDDLYYRLDGDGYFNSARHHLYVVDLDTGKHRLVFDRDSIGWFQYDWSPDSRELAVSANTDRNALLKYWKWDLLRVDARSGKARKIPNLPEGPKSNPRYSPDGKQIAFAGRAGKECWGVRNTHLYVCDLEGGNLRNLTDKTEYCLSAATISDTSEASFEEHFFWTADGKRLVMKVAWQGETHVASVPAAGGKTTFHTSGRQTVVLGNSSADGRRFALVVSDQVTPSEIAVGELKPSKKTGPIRVTPLTGFNESWLDELMLASAEPHWIESASGSKVHLWIMKPPGFKSGKKYPGVLEVHGGPHCQYGETLFHEFQVLAAAGYIVVYSNPRGSKGYGEDHCTAIQGQWGQADWEDIQAVKDFMKQHPSIDETRIGIMGGSYGGYMTNWAIGHTDDFAGAITDRCVSNLVSMVGSSDLPLVPGEYWKGNSWDDTDEIWEQSPLKHFGNVTTPTLVIHSEGDLRCNIEQSEQVFAALKLRGVPTRFVRYPYSTSHGMSRMGPPDLRIHRLEQILEWWATYLD